MNKYSLNPINSDKDLNKEIYDLKRSYNECDKHIQDMRFTEEAKSSAVEIHLYVNLRKAIQDVITALDDIETCRRHLYGEN
mgnify:CR=1 FL=1